MNASTSLTSDMYSFTRLDCFDKVGARAVCHVLAESLGLLLRKLKHLSGRECVQFVADGTA